MRRGPFQVISGFVSRYSRICPWALRTWTTGPMGMNSPVKVIASGRRPPPLYLRSRMRPSMPSFLSLEMSSSTSRVTPGSVELGSLGA